jgi:hypothetical protein
MDNNMATKNNKNFAERQLGQAILAAESNRIGILQQADLKLINLRGQREVFLGQSSSTVGGECEGDFVPSDVNVRVVIGFLGEERDGIYKTH